MKPEYTYKCEACGEEITTTTLHGEDDPLVHWVCDMACNPTMFRVWKKTPVIFKSTGYSKNNLTR